MADAIVAADDDRGILRLIQSIFQRAGYRVVTSTDGETARSIIERDPSQFSAILLDWEMPGISGIDLLRWIKQQPDLAHIPVILETAKDGADQIREGIDAGAFYYVIKPLDPRVLLSIVRAALGDFHYKKALNRKLQETQNPFQNLIEGRFRFRSLAEAELLSLWIANSCPEPYKAMDIVEIMINAVEHGNLGITYEDKSAFIEQDRWGAEVERRMALPEYAEKYVEVGVKKTDGRMTVMVEDQGRGFDFEKYLEFDPARACDSHGRGIVMTGAHLALEYLGCGNQVRVTIPFS